MSLLSFTSRNAINVSSTITRTITKKINHNNAILGYSKRGFSFAVIFQKQQQQQQQQQQQYQSLLVCSTSTKFSTMIMAKPTTSDNIKANSNTNTNTNTNMAMMSSNNRRTMVTSSNKGDNEGKISSSIISNRGGAMIPNVLLMAHNSSSNNIDTNKNNNASELMEKMMIHLPPPDDPVGLQLYKKALYCPLSQILRTSLHVGSDDFNQKVEGIVVAVAGNSSVSEDTNNDAITGSDTQLKEVSIDEARNHARNSGLRLLATIHDYLQGDLSRVEQILTITGIVNSNNNSTYPTDNKNNNNSSMSSRNPITTTSQYHGSIIDGCSQVFTEAFGKEIGIGTRVCYGGNISSTVACYVELRICPS